MSTAVITPLDSGAAVFELNGLTHLFPSWRLAVAEANVRGLPWLLDVPNPPVVEVATT